MARIKDAKDFRTAFCPQWAEETRKSNWTHTLYLTSMKYRLRDGKLYLFWKNYCSLVADPTHSDQRRIILDVGERVRKTCPIVFTISLPFQHELTAEEYEGVKRFLYEVIYSYQTVICMKYQVMKSDLKAVILQAEEPARLADTYYTYCYRIHMPQCHVDLQYHANEILTAVLNECREHSYIHHLPPGVMKDLNELLAVPSIISLYGSIERGYPRWVYSGICDYLCDLDFDEIVDLDNEIPGLDLSDEGCFDIRKHEDFPKAFDGMPDTTFDDYNLWLPMYLSQGYSGKVLNRRDDADKSTPLVYSGNSLDELDEEQDLLGTFLVMLDPRRFQNESTWLDIGRALHHAYQGTSKGLQIWINFTEQHISSKADACESYYEKFEDKRPLITHRSIAWYLFKDSLTVYNNWHQRWILPVMEDLYQERNKPSHYGVARLIYRMFWLTYAVDLEGNWYEFANHGWTNYKKKTLGIRQRIESDLLKYLRDLERSLIERQHETPDEAEKEKFDPQKETIITLLKKIKDGPFLEKCMERSQTMFLIRGFTDELDQNQNLMRLPNGVIEVIPEVRAIFREGKPEDYLAKMGGVRYRQTFSWQSPQVVNFMRWMKQIHHHDVSVQFFLKLNSSYLQGGNQRKYFIVYSGEQGNNAKSTIIACMKRAFGAYHIEMPTEALTSRKMNGGSGPSPELARIDGARIVSSQETDGGDALQSNFVKRQTGNDAFFARGCGADGKDIIPQHKFILCCNAIPEFKYADKATKNRVINIIFNSVWSENAPASEEEQRKTRTYRIDPNFSSKLGEYAEAYLWVCVQYYERYCQTELEIPDEIRNATEAYWKEHDLIQHFIEEKMIKAPEERSGSTSVLKNDVWTSYCGWMDEFHKGKHKLDIDPWTKEMVSRLGKIKEKRFFGWELSDSELI